MQDSEINGSLRLQCDACLKTIVDLIKEVGDKSEDPELQKENLLQLFLRKFYIGVLFSMKREQHQYFRQLAELLLMMVLG